MKAWAKRFYHSKQWLRVRKLAILRANGLCERCERPGYIVHHIIELTPDNVTDPMIALNTDNLEYVCLDCHNAEHMESNGTIDGLMFDVNGDIIKRKKGRDDDDGAR